MNPRIKRYLLHYYNMLKSVMSLQSYSLSGIYTGSLSTIAFSKLGEKATFQEQHYLTYNAFSIKQLLQSQRFK